MATIQWFPGHMAKTKRLIQEQLKLVDVVIEWRTAACRSVAAIPYSISWLEGKSRELLF